jgi:hypothetical protein
MSDPLLPSGISLGSGVAEDGAPLVLVGLGTLLQLGNARVTLSLRPRQARALAALLLKQADTAEGLDRLRVVGGRS